MSIRIVLPLSRAAAMIRAAFSRELGADVESDVRQFERDVSVEAFSRKGGEQRAVFIGDRARLCRVADALAQQRRGDGKAARVRRSRDRQKLGDVSPATKRRAPRRMP